MQATGGATPLMYACQQCKENEVLEILKKQPYSVNDRDRTLKTPLHYCAENSNTNCAEIIVKALPELVNAQDENGYCTLHLAVIAGNKPLIKLLIAKGADVNIHDNEGHSAVHWAIVSSEKEALEMIIRAGANPSTPDIHGGYPLHYAVQMCGFNCDYVRNFEDAVRVVETLLNFGVDVNVKDKDGRQPILWAASAGSADAVIHLISGGACVEAADKDGLTALHCAASRGHTTTLETLITLCGANVDVIDGNGCSALFYSVTLGHADATELLLQLGAESNRQDRKGRTPAHCGAAKGQLETLRILQKHGGNLWMRNVRGDIPLHEAVASGRKDLVLWLLSQCPEAINIANNDGRCPLHIASMYNNTEMVKVLLDSKSLVNPVMRTSKGVLMTPLNVALSRGHRSCGKYLQLHGGVPFSKVSQVDPASGLSIRVSPSDYHTIDTTEKSRDSLTHSQIDISKSRSSTDVVEHHEAEKTETADKKKVYRRRKRKKNPSSAHTQDSDTDESISDLKTKTPEIRKPEEKDNRDEKVKTPKVNSNKKGSAQRNEFKQNKKLDISEESAIVTKVARKAESKPLQRNKSFNETKNVSDLSPEDFPPLMQTIDHLDIVIMEPNVLLKKPESENTELKSQDAGIVDLGKELGKPEMNKAEESYGADVLQKTEEKVQAEEVTGEVLEEQKSKEDIPENSTIVEGKRQAEERKEEKQTEEVPDEQKSERKEETEIKGGRVNQKLSNTSKSSSEGSHKKETRTGKKGSASLMENGGRRKNSSPKVQEAADAKARKSGDETVEKTADLGVSEKKVQDEKPRTEETTEIQNEVVENTKLSIEGILGEDKKSENTSEAQKLEAESAPNIVDESISLNSETPKEKISPIAPEDVSDTLEVEERKLLETQPSITEVRAEEKTVEHEFVTGKERNALEEIETTGPSVAIQQTSQLVENTDVQRASHKNNFVELELETEGQVSQNIESTEPNAEQSSHSQPHEEQSAEFGQTATEKTEEMKGVTGNQTQESINRKDESSDTRPTENNPEDGSREYEPSFEGEEEDEEVENFQKKTSFSEHRVFKPPRVSRLCRRNKDFKDDARHISVTQLVQNTIRKYHIERGIFYQLLELKRYQIRSGKANEQVLVKRLADEYERSRVFLGMKPFSGHYKFKEFEKFLYDQLKTLNARRSFIIPDIKSYDDIDALSSFLKKSRYKIINETPPPELVCTCITQRCHHSACAYTSVPCSAYITDLHRHKSHRPRRQSFFPRIDQTPSETQSHKERPATLELIQGSERHVITLPENSPSTRKRYYVTFTIKGAPDFKEGDFREDSRDYLKHRHAKSV